HVHEWTVEHERPRHLRQIAEAEIEIEHRSAAGGDGELLWLAIAQYAHRHATVGLDLAHARPAGIARGLELHTDDGVAGADHGHDLLHGRSAELRGKARHFARGLLQAALRLLEPPIQLGIVGPDH